MSRRPGEKAPRVIRVGLTGRGIPAGRYTIGPTDIGGLSIECDACEVVVAAWVTGGGPPTAVECLDQVVIHEVENHDGEPDG